MKPVSLRFLSGSVLALLASASFAFAAGDVIKLKTGEKLEGVIKEESPTEVVIELVLGSGGIKDLKTVPRKDIAEVIKATPDQFEAAELAKLVPAEDMMSDNAYQKIITEKLEAFLKKYPASKFKADVESILKTYQDEMAKAKSGAKKLEGVWILPEELVWNAYNFEARLKRVQMEKLLKAGKTADAYRLLAELENNKGASVETVKAMEVIKTALPEFEKNLERLALQQPIILKNRADANKTLSPDDKKRVEEAIKAEEADLKLRQEEDRKAKVAIPSFSEYDIKSINDAKAAVAKEILRIGKIDLAAQKTAATTFQSGLKNMHEKAYLSAQRNFEDAAKFFQKDTFVKQQAELAKKAATEAARANAESTPSKTTASATSTTAKLGDKPGTKTTEPAKTEGGAPVKKKPEPAAESSSTDEPVVVEESSNMPMFLIAGAAVLLIALLVVKSIAKKKAAAEE